jgi:predicted dinucleotide-binding enzyme
MKVGVLGSGDVGHALARGFLARSHDVMMGTRDPKSDKMKAWLAESGPRASSGTFAEAAKFAEVAVLATAWSGTESALQLAAADNLRGKVVIDVTNPLVFPGGKPPPSLALGHTDSGGEQVQRWLPDARVVKAFNIVGNAHMVDPKFPGGPPDMFVCGNDAAAKTTVADICTSFGWPVTDIGGIDGARLLEPLCILWVKFGLSTGGWDNAFKMLRK